MTLWQWIKQEWDLFWNKPDEPKRYPVISDEVIWRRQQIEGLVVKRDKAKGQKKKHLHFQHDIMIHRTWLLRNEP